MFAQRTTLLSVIDHIHIEPFAARRRV